MTHPVEEKLKDLYGLELPAPAAAAGVYSPALISGKYLYISGQMPSFNGEIMAHGSLGATVTIEEGQRAARYCMLNILALAKHALGGFDRVEKFVQLIGYVQCTADFHDQVQVINGASQLLHDVFGEAGVPTRVAIGTNSTPFDVPCEILAVIELKD